MLVARLARLGAAGQRVLQLRCVQALVYNWVVRGRPASQPRHPARTMGTWRHGALLLGNTTQQYSLKQTFTKLNKTILTVII